MFQSQSKLVCTRYMMISENNAAINPCSHFPLIWHKRQNEIAKVTITKNARSVKPTTPSSDKSRNGNPCGCFTNTIPFRCLRVCETGKDWPPVPINQFSFQLAIVSCQSCHRTDELILNSRVASDGPSNWKAVNVSYSSFIHWLKDGLELIKLRLETITVIIMAISMASPKILETLPGIIVFLPTDSVDRKIMATANTAKTR